MEKLTTEEFDKLTLHGRGSSSLSFNAIMDLKVGEGLIIRKKEWHVKYAPTKIANRIEKKYGYKFKKGSLADRSGWAIKRLK